MDLPGILIGPGLGILTDPGWGIDLTPDTWYIRIVPSGTIEVEYALIGETGPLEDFDHWRQLLDFAGLNIRERKSGEYEGEKKITKKGRSRLRKVLSRMAFVLVVRKRLYADYYKRKLESGMCTPELGELWVGVIPPPPRPDW